MTAIQDILNVGVTAQAGALAGSNVKMLKKSKITTKDMVKTSIRNIVGINLLRAQGNVIGGLD